jgi:hypothetical protein
MKWRNGVAVCRGIGIQNVLNQRIEESWRNQSAKGEENSWRRRKHPPKKTGEAAKAETWRRRNGESLAESGGELKRRNRRS